MDSPVRLLCLLDPLYLEQHRFSERVHASGLEARMAEATLEGRVTELESRLAFQDQTIEQLNEALVDQQQRLECVESLARQLRDQLDASLEGPSASTSDRPPHY